MHDFLQMWMSAKKQVSDSKSKKRVITGGRYALSEHGLSHFVNGKQHALYL